MNRLLKDRSGNAHHGTLVGFDGTPQDTPGALNFDVNDDHVVVGSPVCLDGYDVRFVKEE